MLHNEARNLLVKAYEKSYDAKGVALAYEVSVPAVYRLAEHKARTGSVDLRVRDGGCKQALSRKILEEIAETIDEQPDITLAEIVENWTCQLESRQYGGESTQWGVAGKRR